MPARGSGESVQRDNLWKTSCFLFNSMDANRGPLFRRADSDYSSCTLHGCTRVEEEEREEREEEIVTM